MIMIIMTIMIMINDYLSWLALACLDSWIGIWHIGYWHIGIGHRSVIWSLRSWSLEFSTGFHYIVCIFEFEFEFELGNLELNLNIYNIWISNDNR